MNFCILEDVEFPAIDSAGAVGEDGFLGKCQLMNMMHSLKYSICHQWLKYYKLGANLFCDVSLSEVLVAHESETYNIEFQQNQISFELIQTKTIYSNGLNYKQRMLSHI